MSIEYKFAKVSFKMNASSRADFYEDLASALDDSIDIVAYLRKRQERAKKMKDSMGLLFPVILQRMDRLTYFSRAMQEFIPNSEYMAIMAAERGADLPGNLKFLAKTIRDMAVLKKTMVSSVFMPSLVILATIAMLKGFSTKFIPQLTKVFPPERWPETGRNLYALTEIVNNHGGKLVFAGVFLIVTFFHILTNVVGPTRRKLDDYFPFNLVRAYNGALTIISISVLMGAGLSLNESLKQVAASSGKWVRWHMNAVLSRLNFLSGSPGQAFDTGLLPLKILNRVVDRAERSDFGSALRLLGNTIMRDVADEIKTKSKIANIVMLLIAGGLLAFMMFGFLDTVYSIQDAMKKQAF